MVLGKMVRTLLEQVPFCKLFCIAHRILYQELRHLYVYKHLLFLEYFFTIALV